MGCNFVRVRLGFDRGLGGKESTDSLGEGRGRFRKNITQYNRNGRSSDRDLDLPTLLALSGGRNSLSVRSGGLGGNSGGGPPAGVNVAVGPSRTGGVLPFREFLPFPGVGVFLGKRLRVAV